MAFHRVILSILPDLVVGIKSQQKDMIFQTIANVSISKLSKFGARRSANLAHANAKVVLNPVVGDGRVLLFDHIAEKSVPLLKSLTHKILPTWYGHLRKLEYTMLSFLRQWQRLFVPRMI